MATRRQQRRDNKYRGMLLCENCGRWSPVLLDVWNNTIRLLRERNKEYIFLCNRRKCLRGRPEGFLSSLSERRRAEVIRNDRENTYTCAPAQDKGQYQARSRRA